MSIVINITEPYQNRSQLIKKVNWIEKRIPSKEFRVDFRHEFHDGDTSCIKELSAEIVIWADDAERIVFEFWLYN